MTSSKLKLMRLKINSKNLLMKKGRRLLKNFKSISKCIEKSSKYDKNK